MKYYIIAGEASGDLHGANLIKALQKEDAQAECRVWGGDLMQAAGGTLVKHYKELAFMGFLEVLLNLRTILKNISFCKQDIADFQPDVLIFIDYPGFNMRIAKWAKTQNFKTHYYISPQLWAWKENRIHQIKRTIDKMYVILPFEKAFYEDKHQMPVTFVGHPLIDAIANRPKVDAKTLRKTYGLSDQPIVALLPGSRQQEIKKMLQRLKKNGSKFSMRKLSNNEEKVYEANISLFNALQFTDSDLKGKFALKRFIAAHCIILAIEGVPAFYFNSLFATKNDEETFANTGVKRNLNRYKWHYSTLVDLIKTNNTIERNCYEIFKELISIRKIQPAFHPNATQFTLNLDKNIFAVWRQSRDRKQSIFALTNVSSKTIKFNTNKINLIDDEQWFDLLSPNEKIIDGKFIKLNPYQTAWITNFRV